MKKVASAYKKMIVVVAALLLCIPAGLRAQDFHLSQYDAAPMYLNPAMTGMINGYYRIHAHYRTQWASVAAKPFQTSEISFDMPWKKIGLGAEIMDNRAGAGDFNVFNFHLSAAYDHPLDKNNFHHIAFGLQAGLIHKSVNLNKLVFGNQYVPTDGGSFDNTLASGELLGNARELLHDENVGLMYYYGNNDSRFNPFVGLSAFHLAQPQESFFNADSKLPVRMVAHAGFRFIVNETVQLAPKFLYMKQSNDQEMAASLILNYYLKGSDAYIIFGPTWRRNDASIIEGGLKYGKYVYRLSYDINTSTLKPTTNGRGGFEISVTYVPKKQKPNPIPNCPRL
jgi:type IX secretion system PorP/SprF family membrane protein